MVWCTRPHSPTPFVVYSLSCFSCIYFGEETWDPNNYDGDDDDDIGGGGGDYNEVMFLSDDDNDDNNK